MPVTKLLQNLKGLGRQRLIALALVGAAVLLGVALVGGGMMQPRLGVLYAGLDEAEAGRIIGELEGMRLPYRMQPNGTLLVPEEEVARTRMVLAEQGLPTAGGAGYELFDSQGALGLTSFMQKMNRLRALEGELGRTIQTLAGIESARVHLVLPDPETFSREAAPPTASVVVRTAGGQPLGRDQAQAIRHLVSAAAPRLQPGAVTVMDQTGVALAAAEEGDGLVGALKADEMRAAVERRIGRALEEMLLPGFGAGHVRVRVAAELDLGRETLREQNFNPDGRVIRSTQTVEERERATEADTDRPVTVEQNLPLEEAGSTPVGSATDTAREEETINYEISSILRERAQEAGEIERLAVAVLVNDRIVLDDAGNGAWQPRSAEELQRIENVVKTAIGYTAARGDTVTVENIRFVDMPLPVAPVAPPPPTLVETLKVQAPWLATLMAAAVALLLFALLAVRPLLARGTTGGLEPALAGVPAGALAGTEAPPALPDGTATPGAAALTHESRAVALAEDGEEGDGEGLVDMVAVEGGVSMKALRRLAEIVDEHPEESLVIVRTWIYEGSA